MEDLNKNGPEAENSFKPAGPPKFQLGEGSEIKKIIAVMSGKGGVGKSAVTVLLASALRRKGFEVGILDADITGPSVPRSLGISGPIIAGTDGVIPAVSRSGIKVMSMNLILPAEDEAIIWRGPLISGAVRQFYEECQWGKLDYLVIDLPPGTSDVPLTIIQSIPLDGIVLVTSPQQLVGVIVSKAARMAASMNAPVLGMVENMSYIKCPSCGEEIRPFGDGEVIDENISTSVPVIARLPLDPDVAKLADKGLLEDYDTNGLHDLIEKIS
ncbi:MAG: Mrp/NBP35 family ATP-binding protein [Actinobacteria bacterium]|nr:Mrp/NBP35 family ATP-binding protein [Actinomycetota bacterium]